jgi:tRNA(Ile2) C34 agmatinyltransferase TiaS
MTTPIQPLPCPNCGERQNSYAGRFDPAAEPFGPFRCMACGHQFTSEEFRAAERAAGDS